ncbi:hypothetical protein K8R47_01320 [archaeon]|nr:hypothetical protein [archaeon]
MNNMQDPMERIKILESRYNLMRERLLIINQNMINEYKKISKDMNLIENEVKEIRSDMFEIKEAVQHIVHELKFFAKKDQLLVLEKYINLWNPLNFVTEKEVLELIKKHRGGKSSKPRRKKK